MVTHPTGATGRTVSAVQENDLVTVRTFFNLAISKGYRGAENPASKIGTPKIDWEAPSILTASRFDKNLKLDGLRIYSAKVTPKYYAERTEATDAQKV